ncbi:MAG: hypothetical protein ACRDQ9_11750, partial [Pseudonocardiaceae bacterium]
QEIRTYETTTNSLLELRDWLVEQKVTLAVLDNGRLLSGCVLPAGGPSECDAGQCRARQGPAGA